MAADMNSKMAGALPSTLRHRTGLSEAFIASSDLSDFSLGGHTVGFSSAKEAQRTVQRQVGPEAAA